MNFRYLKIRHAILLGAGILTVLCQVGCGSAGGTYSPTSGVGTKAPPATADFSIAVTPATTTVFQGQTATYTVTVKSVNGFSSAVSLTLGTVPAGTSILFTPATVTPTSDGGTSTLTAATSNSSDTTTPAGTYTLTVAGSAAGLSHQATTQIVVQAPGSLQGAIQ